MEAKIWNYRCWISECEPDVLKKSFNLIVIKSRFTILDFMEYNFTPYGYTAIWLLAESHLAIHTFPEHNTSYIELSSCNEEMNKAYIDEIKKYYNVNET